MPFRVGDVARYHHGLLRETKQLTLYHREKLDGKLAVILDVAHDENISDYYCYIDGRRLWINEVLLFEVTENEHSSEEKNS